MNNIIKRKNIKSRQCLVALFKEINNNESHGKLMDFSLRFVDDGREIDKQP